MPAFSRSLSLIVSASALLGAASFTGCSGSDPAQVEGPGSSPTFHKDVEPILQKSCMGCHSTGNIAPFSLTPLKTSENASTHIPSDGRQMLLTSGQSILPALD